jgi:hypothetical protein
MTVYANLLSQALAEDDSPEMPVGDQISSALAWRENMARSVDAASRLTATLAYDLALIRLCRHFGVHEELTGPLAGPAARTRAEEALAPFVPTLGVVLR